MKIIETKKYKKLAQWGPEYHDPIELRGPEKDIAGTHSQLAANYAFVKAMSGMNLARFGGFPQERIDLILSDFREDLEEGETDPDVAEEHASQAEALRNKPVALMRFFMENSPIPGSHSEFMRQRGEIEELGTLRKHHLKGKYQF